MISLLYIIGFLFAEANADKINVNCDLNTDNGIDIAVDIAVDIGVDIDVDIDSNEGSSISKEYYHENYNLINDSVFESLTNGTEFLSIKYSHDGINFSSKGLQMTIKKPFDNPSLVSTEYIMYGKVEAEIKGSHGSGLVSSFYLQSKDLDEIDIAEILGSDPYRYQTNFFIKGNTTTYDRGDFHNLPIHLSHDQFYKYGCEWTFEKIVWFLNDVPVRELIRGNKHGMPTSPMRVIFSLWAGEDTQNKDTIAWSGGLTDYSRGPFTMTVRNLRVENYIDE